MKTKVCKACLLEKTLDKFHKCPKCFEGTINICKICKSKGLKISRDYVKPKFNIEWSKNDAYIYRLNGVSQEDFRVMYEFLKGFGYDIHNDIHQQFLDRWNPVSKKPIKYKERNYRNLNKYLSDGTKNPVWQPTAYIRKPQTN